MKMQAKDDGPAFPWGLGPSYGMSLRDWFAGMAMQSLLTRGWVNDDIESDPIPYCEQVSDRSSDNDEVGLNDLAKDAYRTADAMLAERAKEKT